MTKTGKAVKETISVFGRIRPPDASKKRRHGTGDYEVIETKEGPVIRLRIPKSISQGYVNNQLVDRMFPFTRVLGMETKQEEVFDTVAMPVIQDALNGYNGTIFAYGQTGSGKTYTITGGPEKYENRGIIPRAITRIFSDVTRHRDQAFTLRISYLEIYNGVGYDLLDPSHENKKLADLPKVKMMEDEYGNFKLLNISTLPVATEEEALNLLFVGDTNRMICETPTNDVSSRSHCIFTIHLEGRLLGGNQVQKSKLHMVDLAGSERVSKTAVDGTILGEACAINLSLHFLERVIIALHNKSRGKAETHIPYRDSMVTSFLKDSLGGNCRTVMIAALSMDIRSLDETISTMRFAQRVGMIKNSATVNLSMDPDAVIKRLKLQVKQLEDENKALRGDADLSIALTEEQKGQCLSFCESYILPNTTITLPTANPKQVEACYEVLRNMILTNASSKVEGRKSKEAGKDDEEVDTDTSTLREQLKAMQRSLKERDNEIRILVGLLKKYKKVGRPQKAWLSPKSIDKVKETAQSSSHSTPKPTAGTMRKLVVDEDVPDEGEALHSRRSHKASIERAVNSPKPTPTLSKEELMVKRHEAFVKYRETYKHNKSINSQKDALRSKFKETKQKGREVNITRARINAIKLEIENLRAERAVNPNIDKRDALASEHAEEKLLEKIADEKKLYKEKYTQLKSMKSEIEHMKHLLENARRKLQLDFEAFWVKSMKMEKLKAAGESYNSRVLFESQSSEAPPSQEHLRSHVQSSRNEWGSVGKMPAPIGDIQVDREVKKFYKVRDSILKEAWG